MLFEQFVYLLMSCWCGRPRNRSSRSTRSIQDNCRSTRLLTPLSTRLWSTAIDLIDFLVDSLALLPVAWIVCIVCELVKPFRGLVLMYRCSGLTLAVSLTISQIFSVKEWRELETQVRGRSRSLKMAPFDRTHETFCWSAIVNIALSCTILSFFWRWIIRWACHWNWCHSNVWVRFPIHLL